MDYNNIGETLLRGGILIVSRRIEPQCLGTLSHLLATVKNSLSSKLLEFASLLSPYDTLEFNYGDQKVILYRLKANILVLTLATPRINPKILEQVLPKIRELGREQNI